MIKFKSGLLLMCILMVFSSSLAYVDLMVLVKEDYSEDYIYLEFEVSNNKLEKLDLGLTIPFEFYSLNWQARGVSENSIEFDNNPGRFKGQDCMIYHWAVENAPEEFSITVDFASEKTGSFDLNTILVHPEGFETFAHKINIIPDVPAAQTSGITGHFVYVDESVDEITETIEEEIIETHEHANRIKNISMMFQSISI